LTKESAIMKGTKLAYAAPGLRLHPSRHRAVQAAGAP
jgi:hypothetical protein